jgi:hypothetical protein
MPGAATNDEEEEEEATRSGATSADNKAARSVAAAIGELGLRFFYFILFFEIFLLDFCFCVQRHKHSRIKKSLVPHTFSADRLPNHI